MNRRGTGSVFCSIGAFFLASRYIAAAIFGSNITTWNKDFFKMMLDSVGTPLKTLGIWSFIIGLSYLVWAEISKEK